MARPSKALGAGLTSGENTRTTRSQSNHVWRLQSKTDGTKSS
jgi:hypothetical protein